MTRPAISDILDQACEYRYGGNTADAIIDALAEHGYEIYDAVNIEPLIPLDDFEQQQTAWRELLGDRDRLRQFVEVLAEHGLRLTEAGTVEVIQCNR